MHARPPAPTRQVQSRSPPPSRHSHKMNGIKSRSFVRNLLSPTASCYHLLLLTITYCFLLAPTASYCHLLLHTITYCFLLSATASCYPLLLLTITYCFFLSPTASYYHLLLLSITYCFLRLFHLLSPSLIPSLAFRSRASGYRCGGHGANHE